MEQMMNITVNGWTYDPAQQEWTARIADNRWLTIKGDLDDPPSMTPWAVDLDR